MKYAPKIVEEIWKIAHNFKYYQFKPYPKYQIYDDYILLNENGLSIFLIDFDYLFWHTLKDDVDKCDKKSLKIIGDVLLPKCYAVVNIIDILMSYCYILAILNKEVRRNVISDFYLCCLSYICVDNSRSTNF